MTTKRPKRKARRRHVTPPRTPTASTEARLVRAAWIASLLGVTAVLLAIAIQLHLLPIPVGARGVRVLQAAGAGLVIAGIIFGRSANRS